MDVLVSAARLGSALAAQMLRVLLLLLSSTILSTCGFESGGNAPGGPQVAASTAATCTAPNRATLDLGVKVGAAGTARGIWSDVKYIPSGVSAGSGAASGNVVQYSSNVGVAYVDTGAQALKYSYWNGSTFKTEVVFGDSVANITYVRLGYLSNAPNTGIPLIFFSNGAVNNGQIMLAVRSSASLTAVGTWTVRAIDANAGTANRALELSISPIDQVGLVFQGTTAPTANNIRFVYCSADCASAASYVPQAGAASSRIDNGATAAQVHLGIGWCQRSAGIYNPAVVYGASATSFQFAICNTASAGNDLSSCLLNTAWIRTTATMAATGASGTISDLYLDPSIIDDTPKMVVKDAGASLKTFSTSVGCANVVAGTSYTAAGTSAIVGSGVANIATSHLKILKAPDYADPTNERFYLAMTDGTTAVRWASSTSNNFNGAWNANATGIIQTVTLSAAGSTNMGADLNLTTRQLIASYGTAAGLFNITLGVVNDFSSPADPSSASHIYYQLPVESNGHMQMNATQYNNVAVAATSGSLPAVAWVDFSSGVATTGRLKYSLRSGARSTDTWKIFSIPGVFGTPAPQYPSLAFDHLDRPWIGYWDSQGAAGRFVLATNTASDGSGTWTSYMFPVISAGHGAPAAQPAANTPTVAMSYSGGVASPVMIVIDNGTTKAVKSAKLNPNTGAWSAITTIEALAAQGGAFLTADWSTSSNLIAISYQVLTTGQVKVRYTASTDGSTWPVNASVPYSVSGLAQGEGTRIKINPVTAKPAVSYYDRANSRLYFAPCTANCTGTGVPTFSGVVSAVASGLGITGLSAVGNANLLDASLTYTAAGDAHIVYNSGQLDKGGLYMIDNVGGSMPSAAATAVVAGMNGAFSNASATNGGIPWGQRAVRMANGVLAMAYIAPGSWLEVATCGD